MTIQRTEPQNEDDQAKLDHLRKYADEPKHVRTLRLRIAKHKLTLQDLELELEQELTRWRQQNSQ